MLDIFRKQVLISVLIYEKEQESQKRIFHNRAKNFIFMRGFDSINTFF